MKGGDGFFRRSPRSTDLTTKGSALEVGDDGLGLGLGGRDELLPVLLPQRRDELGRHGRRQVGVEAPVLLGHEGPDLPLALADQADRDRLDAAGREAAAHALPEERADLVADQPVEDAPGLLGVHPLLVDPARAS